MVKTIKSPVNFRRSVALERLTSDFKEFFLALLEKDPKDRPTASEAIEMLRWLHPWDRVCGLQFKIRLHSYRGENPPSLRRVLVFQGLDKRASGAQEALRVIRALWSLKPLGPGP